MEKRHNYVRKVAETAVTLFVSNDKVNVAGMVLAGSADFKTELSQSDMFDPVSNSRPTVPGLSGAIVSIAIVAFIWLICDLFVD